MKIVLNDGDYIELNRNSLIRILDSINEFYLINKEEIKVNKKGKEEVKVYKKNPSFVNIIKSLINEDELDEFMYSVKIGLFNERTLGNKKKYFSLISKENKRIWNQINEEVNYDSAIRFLYNELLEYKNSTELMTIEERKRKGIGSSKELDKEKRLNPNYDYDYLRKLYNLSLEQISYVKNNNKVKEKILV